MWLKWKPVFYFIARSESGNPRSITKRKTGTEFLLYDAKDFCH